LTRFFPILPSKHCERRVGSEETNVIRPFSPSIYPEFFIRLLCPPDGLVADPFAGSGTTGIAALSLGRRCVLIDNNEKFCDIARTRIKKEANARDEELTTVPLREGTYTREIPQKTEEQIRFFEDAPEFAADRKKTKKRH
jgi:16S rRNA G966 N2-methylase RsmD